MCLYLIITLCTWITVYWYTPRNTAYLKIHWYISLTIHWHIECVFKKRTNFAINTLFYNILSTVPFKVVPSTGDTPFPTFLPLLECVLWRRAVLLSHFPESTRVQKKKEFLNSSPTSKEGALRLLSAPSGRSWQQTATCPVSLWALVVQLHPQVAARGQAVRWINPTNSLCTCSIQRM
jgi:hypothetical protein